MDFALGLCLGSLNSNDLLLCLKKQQKKTLILALQPVENHVSPGTLFATYKWENALFTFTQMTIKKLRGKREVNGILAFSWLYYSIKGRLNTSGIACYAIY